MAESVLDKHKLYYEDMAPRKLNTRKGGKDMKMSSNKSTVTEAPKASRKYAKTRGEHIKDIVIAILVAGVIAFIGGMHFANNQHAQMDSAVKAAQSTAVAPVKK